MEPSPWLAAIITAHSLLLVLAVELLSAHLALPALLK